jgi:enoyl-CoA hydratase
MENLILTSIENGVATLCLNRPDKLNALSRAMIYALATAFEKVEEDKSVQAIVITGSGEKAFVAGADIAEFLSISKDEVLGLCAYVHDLFAQIENCTKPVIACINGFALGGGLELAMACHIRLASENAVLGLPETSLGIIPGYGGTQRLPAIVGKAKALEMILSAGKVNALEAKNMGLVSYVTPLADLHQKALALAQNMLKTDALARSEAIQAVNAHFDKHINGFQREIALFGECFGSEGFTQRVTAFLHKEK